MVTLDEAYQAEIRLLARMQWLASRVGSGLTIAISPKRERDFDYYEYLSSPEWFLRRSQALWFADGRCSICNSPDDLDVHHRTYDRVGHELTKDLTVLCRRCHTIFHNKLPVFSGSQEVEF